MSMSPITVSEIFNYFHLVIVTTFSFFLKHKDMNKYTDKITKICMQKRKKGERKRSSFTLQCKYCLIVRRVT